MNDAVACTIETPVHGRFVVRAPQARPIGVLVGFHGYAENADIHLRALAAIPGSDAWLLVAVQALHPFYTRDQRVVANWMTSQDRELAIADNINYVRRVRDSIRADHQIETTPIVWAGFSQGGAMAYRAAAHLGADGLVILAADLPPDIAAMPDVRLPRVLIGRGTADQWYTAEKQATDLATLDRLGVSVDSCVFEGGHEWVPAFSDAASQYLRGLSL